MKNQGLTEEFLAVVKGFADSLVFLRAALPNRKESFKLTVLAEHFNINTSDAHDALGDVRLSARVVTTANIADSFILRHAKTVAAVVQREQVKNTSYFLKQS